MIISKLTTSSKIKNIINVKNILSNVEAYLLKKKKQYNEIKNAVNWDPQLWEPQSPVRDTSWKSTRKATKYKMDTNK
jgi:hypothetical protein